MTLMASFSNNLIKTQVLYGWELFCMKLNPQPTATVNGTSSWYLKPVKLLSRRIYRFVWLSEQTPAYTITELLHNQWATTQSLGYYTITEPRHNHWATTQSLSHHTITDPLYNHWFTTQSLSYYIFTDPLHNHWATTKSIYVSLLSVILTIILLT